MTTRGRAKLEKHVSLGVALKYLTGSKKVITYLNKLGHCVNYHCIEELETGLGSSLVNQQSLLPEGTLKNLSAGLAFDNYDEFTNTLSGEGTLHNTMVILYQNVGSNQPVSKVTQNWEKCKTKQKKKKKEKKVRF